MQDSSSPLIVTEHVLLKALANITYVSTLKDAYHNTRQQMPSDSWQLAPNCSSGTSNPPAASDSWGSNSGSKQQQQQQQQDVSPPSAPLLWWVDFQQQQQQQSSRQCNALGAAEQEMVPGVSCNKRLPFICTGEPLAFLQACFLQACVYATSLQLIGI
jgi:hypothetical protein